MEKDKVKTANLIDDSISLVVDEPVPHMESAEEALLQFDLSAIAAKPDETSAAQDHDERNYTLPPRFTQVSLIGEGGMSNVYKATDTADGDKVVAVKLLKKELSRDPLVIERFLREAKAMQALSHKNITQIFDSGKTDDNVPFLVLEYVDGGSLADAIQREGHLEPGRTRKLITQVCHALEAAHHRYIIHRDIKPSNILLAIDDNGEEQAKLVDFGIAKPSSAEPLFNTDLTQTGMILGSPAYMSPEQCRGGDVDERSDFYSLGCVMYEALTGKCPFEAATPVKAIVRHLTEPPAAFDVQHGTLSIPLGLEEVVMKCLEKQPRHRYQSARQLEKALNSPSIPARKAVLIADAIDLTLCVLLTTLIAPPLSSALFKILTIDPTSLNWHSGTEMRNVLFFGSILLPALWCYALYFGLFEASKWQATPGKLLNGIKIRDKDNRRLGLAAALLCPMAVASTLATVWFTPMLIWTFLPISHSNSLWETDSLFFLVGAIITANILGLSVTGNPVASTLLARTVGRPNTAALARKSNGLDWQKWLLLSFFAVLPVIATAGGLELCRKMNFGGDVPMVVADHQIQVGDKITAKDVTLIRTFKSFLPRKPVAHSTEELIGKTAKVQMFTGDPITTDQIDLPANRKTKDNPK